MSLVCSIEAMVPANILASDLGERQLHRSFSGFNDVFAHFRHFLAVFELIISIALLVGTSLQHSELVSRESCPRAHLLSRWLLFFSKFSLVVVFDLIEDDVLGFFEMDFVAELLALSVQLLKSFEISAFDGSFPDEFFEFPHFGLEEVDLSIIDAFESIEFELIGLLQLCDFPQPDMPCLFQ